MSADHLNHKTRYIIGRKAAPAGGGKIWSWQTRRDHQPDVAWCWSVAIPERADHITGATTIRSPYGSCG